MAPHTQPVYAPLPPPLGETHPCWGGGREGEKRAAPRGQPQAAPFPGKGQPSLPIPVPPQRWKQGNKTQNSPPSARHSLPPNPTHLGKEPRLSYVSFSPSPPHSASRRHFPRCLDLNRNQPPERRHGAARGTVGAVVRPRAGALGPPPPGAGPHGTCRLSGPPLPAALAAAAQPEPPGAPPVFSRRGPAAGAGSGSARRCASVPRCLGTAAASQRRPRRGGPGPGPGGGPWGAPRARPARRLNARPALAVSGIKHRSCERERSGTVLNTED